ncbi:hypothetical protein AB1N83_003026 [Pleurotus pulmonarius]
MGREERDIGEDGWRRNEVAERVFVSERKTSHPIAHIHSHHTKRTRVFEDWVTWGLIISLYVIFVITQLEQEAQLVVVGLLILAFSTPFIPCRVAAMRFTAAAFSDTTFRYPLRAPRKNLAPNALTLNPVDPLDLQ